MAIIHTSKIVCDRCSTFPYFHVTVEGGDKHTDATTDGTVRKYMQREGWHFMDGKDLCPLCFAREYPVSSMSKRVR